MQPSADATRMRELCGQFEEVLLATFVPQSLFKGSPSGDQDGADDSSLASGAAPALFSEAFSAAIERSGGLGLAPELTRWISET